MTPSRAWFWVILLLGDVRTSLTEDINSVVDAFTANTTGSELNCYDNLDRVAEDMEARDEATLFEIVEYVLCPNTVFNIGAPRDSLDNIGGQESIRLRQNSRIVCGADGKSSNNCILLGGLFQAVAWSHTYSETTKENVEVSGVTFRDAAGSAVLLVAAGDVTFTDCIFDNQRNGGPLQFLFVSDDDERRRLQDVGNETMTTQALSEYYHDILTKPESQEAEKQESRSLQGSPERELTIAEFDNCVFQFNAYGVENAATTHHGVINIESPSNKLIVRNSIFHENNFGDEGITATTSVIDAFAGSELILENNCFLNNDLIGRGTVMVASADQLLSVENNFGTFDAGLKCQFIHVNGGDQCIEYDIVDSCPLDFVYEDASEAEAPSASPTSGAATGSMVRLAMTVIGTLLVLVAGWF